MDTILTLVSVLATASVSLFSVALPQILESRRSSKDFTLKRVQLYLDNKYSAYHAMISAYVQPHFDAAFSESTLELRRAIFRAISVSHQPLSAELQNLLPLIDEPAATFHQKFQPAFVRCLSLISQDYTATIELLNSSNKSKKRQSHE